LNALDAGVGHLLSGRRQRVVEIVWLDRAGRAGKARYDEASAAVEPRKKRRERMDMTTSA
jgi:hypothetical protein